VVSRSDADIKVAKTSRFDDAQLLLQPYTFYSAMAPSAPNNSLGWSIGLTVPLPIYNRQQGNILKAQSISSQSRIQTASLERTVEVEVRRAVRQHEVALKAVEKVIQEQDIQGGRSQEAIENLKERFKAKSPQEDVDLYDLVSRLEKVVKDSDDQILKNFDALLVQHRRAMLKLNTAVGRRVLP